MRNCLKVKDCEKKNNFMVVMELCIILSVCVLSFAVSFIFAEEKKNMKMENCYV